jgi:hypothetical protein
MSTDWNGFADRGYWKSTDVALAYDTTDSAGKNITAPNCFGGAAWATGQLNAYSNTSGERAISGHYSHNSGGSAFTARVDYVASVFYQFYFGASTGVGTISTNGTSTSYNTSSDYRLKEDLRAIADPLGRLAALSPVNFRWKTSGARSDGFIAHEVAEIVPDAVHGAKDAIDEVTGAIVSQGLDQSKLVPLIVAAIQAQQTMIAQQAARIAALEAAAGI